MFIITKSILSFVTAEEVQWSAFGTLGLTLADSNQLGYRNNINSDNGVFAGDLDFQSNSLLGGQVDVSINRELEFLGQVVLKDMNDATASDFITMAFFKYSPSAKWSVRLGRLIPDLFKITEYRNINVAYTWTNVPTEVYALSPFEHLDGGDITYKTRFNSGTLKYKFFLGKSQSVVHAFGDNQHFDLSSMLGASISYDQFDWNIQGRYTKITFDNNADAIRLLSEQIELVPEYLWPNRLDFSHSLNLKDSIAKYYSFSGQKEWQNWLFSFEVGRIVTEATSELPVDSGYFSASYRHGANTYYGLYSQSSADNYIFDEPIDTQYFPELIKYIEDSKNFYSTNQTTYSIGWRRDISTNLTSKFQLNVTNVDENGATLWLREQGNDTGRTVTSVMFTLSFAL
ncbi:hypothetical protein [Paraglaciecola sp. L3A3]|uniref:hypothetical protein n=1 Tax=Paraglaciecola sp. L3A3 TaxID=2686358 RepID=UPI00131D920B|nr:hypothetical protein [Paraglaciecola sp. L3A3]